MKGRPPTSCAFNRRIKPFGSFFGRLPQSVDRYHSKKLLANISGVSRAQEVRDGLGCRIFQIRWGTIIGVFHLKISGLRAECGYPIGASQLVALASTIRKGSGLAPIPRILNPNTDIPDYRGIGFRDFSFRDIGVRGTDFRLSGR